MAPDDSKDSGDESQDVPPDEEEATGPDTPGEPEQERTGAGVDSAPDSPDAAEVDQSEIDALIRGLDKPTSTQPPAEESAPSHAESESSSAGDAEVDQGDIDTLIRGPDDSASSQASQESSEPSEATIEEVLVDEAPTEEPDLLEQDELDALIADFENREKSSKAQTAAPKMKVEQPSEAEIPEEPAPAEDTDLDAVPVDSGRQSDIDLLVAQASQESSASDEVPLDDASQEITPDAAQETSDPEIEAALLELEQSAAEKSSLSKEEIASQATAAQEEADALQVTAETAAVESQVLNAEGDDAPLIDHPADETLVDRDMDERLDPVAENLEAEAADEAEELAGVTEEAAKSAAFSDVEANATDAPSDPAAMLEHVARENISAGAVENAEAPAAAPVASAEVEPATPAKESAPSEEVVPETVDEDLPAQSDRPRAFSGEGSRIVPTSLLIERYKQSPVRVITSLAAGITFALAAFVYFYANQLQTAPELRLFPVGDAADLNRIILLARELIDEGKSSEAVKLLDEAIARAPERVSGLDDARYLRLEGVYQGLPETIPASVADRMHSEIDYLVETARSHPRAPEALYWKAKVYEREDNPIAARAEYRGILDNFGNAANLGQVLIALSERLLAADRPIQAVPYLQRVIQDFPRTSLAARARLYLGDAYAAVGDSDAAGFVYINLADNQPNTSIGALAFERVGKLALESGDYSGAIRELEARLEKATTVEGNERVYLLLAKAYRATDDLRNARDILTELIEFFPESEITPSALVELSQVMSDMGLDREAVRMATQAVQRFPDNIEVLRNAGVLLGESGDALSAARSLFAAHSAGANEPELLLAAGRHFKKAGAEDEAVAVFEELLMLFPTSSQALQGNIEWARVFFERGEIKKALERLEELTLATEGQSRALPVLRAMGEMYADLGLKREVIRVYAQIAGLAQEPELLAEAAVVLIREGEADAGMRVVERIDRSNLRPETAYALMMAEGNVWLMRNAAEALEIMEKAHAAYPEHRTPEGVQKLLEANLTTGQSARARAMVSELQARAAQSERPDESAWLERAAIAWGDYLYKRKDYRTALEAYTIVLEPARAKKPRANFETAGGPLSEPQLWSMYQRANSLFGLMRFQECLEFYETVAASNSVWADDAGAKAESARIEIRLRGDPVAEARSAG